MFQRVKKVLAGAVALAALAVGGSAIAGAATSQTTSTTNTSTAQAPPAFHGPAPGTAAHENAEKAVTGTAAGKAQAAAVKAVGGGTAGPVTSDLPGTGLETTVTKANGSKVEVHLDSSYNVFRAPGGMPGGQHGPPPGASGG